MSCPTAMMSILISWGCGSGSRQSIIHESIGSIFDTGTDSLNAILYIHSYQIDQCHILYTTCGELLLKSTGRYSPFVLFIPRCWIYLFIYDWMQWIISQSNGSNDWNNSPHIVITVNEIVNKIFETRLVIFVCWIVCWKRNKESIITLHHSTFLHQLLSRLANNSWHLTCDLQSKLISFAIDGSANRSNAYRIANHKWIQVYI